MENLSTDLLVGVEAIADFIGLEPRQVNHMAATNQIPTFKLGNKWACKKSGMRRFFEELEKSSWPSTT